MKLIFYIFLFYILYKALVYFLKYMAGSMHNKNLGNDIRNPKPKPQSNNQPKKDIEEADYREIKDDDDKS